MRELVVIKAIDYIKEHLDEELTVESISNHCHFSKYYFNRIFKENVGESVYAFIKRLRIERSAGEIFLKKDVSITEVSADYGYSSSNYSTAFKKHFGKSPVSYIREREENNVINLDRGYHADLSDKTYDSYNDCVEIVEIEDMTVIFKRYIGDYKQLKTWWCDFYELYSHYITDDSYHMEIGYDDPVLTHPDRLITDICLTTSKEIGEDCHTMILQGGKFAKFRFEGPSFKIFEMFQGILCVWGRETSYEFDFDTRKTITRYIFADAEKNHFIIDILVPVI